jgi:hypothetical protein
MVCLPTILLPGAWFHQTCFAFCGFLRVVSHTATRNCMHLLLLWTPVMCRVLCLQTLGNICARRTPPRRICLIAISTEAWLTTKALQLVAASSLLLASPQVLALTTCVRTRSGRGVDSLSTAAAGASSCLTPLGELRLLLSWRAPRTADQVPRQLSVDNGTRVAPPR